MSNSSQFCTICELAGGTLCPSTQVINKDAKQFWTLYQLLGYTTDDLPPGSLCITDHRPLGPVIQSVLNLLHCALIRPILRQPGDARRHYQKHYSSWGKKNPLLFPALNRPVHYLFRLTENYWEYYYFSSRATNHQETKQWESLKRKNNTREHNQFFPQIIKAWYLLIVNKDNVIHRRHETFKLFISPSFS